MCFFCTCSICCSFVCLCLLDGLIACLVDCWLVLACESACLFIHLPHLLWVCLIICLVGCLLVRLIDWLLM